MEVRPIAVPMDRNLLNRPSQRRSSVGKQSHDASVGESVGTNMEHGTSSRPILSVE
jgi:hypothetical protein